MNNVRGEKCATESVRAMCHKEPVPQTEPETLVSGSCNGRTLGHYVMSHHTLQTTLHRTPAVSPRSPGSELLPDPRPTDGKMLKIGQFPCIIQGHLFIAMRLQLRNYV